ncbi:DNA repair endonuclease XPF [Neocloeon triangulifer]|uniref:DNA repair endonuclease XPF n=1 Tax=Neocloeon triangulifer TaxID=2078957 RepID=UPI00286F1B93|nr:DNA repair endonuclease XPF [Neocloeon triangulifer]
MPRMLEYERQMLLEAVGVNCLMISAAGLDIERVLEALLRSHLDPRNLVLVVGTGTELEQRLADALGVPSNAQKVNYDEGGVVFVTARVLVVDSLRDRVPLANVTGIVMLRAHAILAQEAFALRLFRQRNPNGFILAVSDAPYRFSSHTVRKVMRTTFCDNLFLWPRFHSVVVSALSVASPEVIELHVKMTPTMVKIQTALLELLSFCVRELKRVNPALLDDLNVEEALAAPRVLQRLLEPIWHQLGPKSRQLIADAKTLRTLLRRLCQSDGASFVAQLAPLRTSEYAQRSAGWLLLPAAESLFVLAKTRDGNEKEICPKWSALADVLDEESKENADTKILILCEDRRTCRQLLQYLSQKEVTPEEDQTFFMKGQCHVSLEPLVSPLEQLLIAFDPQIIVLYDANIVAVRQLEVFQARHPEPRLRVYFLIFGGSVEEQLYLTSLRQEKNAFEALVKEKAMLGAGEVSVEVGVESDKHGIVLVDVREFRSELPNLLHQKEVRVDPITLKVGDYIVTRDLCVERKSVSDLIGSLNSGRLHKQATAMQRNYKRPVLLIEYESKDISRLPMQRLQLLTMMFPKLRIIWSPNPHASAEMLVELKTGHEQPSLEHAAASHRYDTPLMHEQFDTTMKEFVSCLPGVNSKSLRRVLCRGGSLAELFCKNESELADLTGTKSTGASLHMALHKALSPHLQQNTTRPKKQPLKRKWPSKKT